MLKKQPGFLFHVSYEDADGLVVAEVWETRDQHDAFLDADVKPNVPIEITPEVIEASQRPQAVARSRSELGVCWRAPDPDRIAQTRWLGRQIRCPVARAA
jgi:hypothetical protein